jgi:hypothetical protein
MREKEDYPAPKGRLIGGTLFAQRLSFKFYCAVEV